jgi:hypothetical protein
VGAEATLGERIGSEIGINPCGIIPDPGHETAEAQPLLDPSLLFPHPLCDPVLGPPARAEEPGQLLVAVTSSAS